MKHCRDNGQKHANARVSVDMLPKGVQRAHRDKQLDVLKRMFKRVCVKIGLLHEMKEREYYIKPGEKRRRAERQKKANAREQRDQQNLCEFDQEPKFEEAF
jgi:ribosomal protein S21